MSLQDRSPAPQERPRSISPSTSCDSNAGSFPGKEDDDEEEEVVVYERCGYTRPDTPRDDTVVPWRVRLAAFGWHIVMTVLNEKSPLRLLWIIGINFLPILLWICTFKNARLIPASIRPAIHVNLLPQWEHAVFETAIGFAATTGLLAVAGTLVGGLRIAIPLALVPLVLNTLYTQCLPLTAAKDVLAWLPYGVLHFVSPFLTAAWLWFMAVPGLLGVYGRAFGTQNIIGVLVHLLLPTAAPWYSSDEYGYGMPPQPGNYSLPGSAAGLKRVDAVLGTHIYTHAFHASPLVFGAFPSLHSAFACMNFLFVARTAAYAVGKNGGGKTVGSPVSKFLSALPSRAALLVGAFVCWQWWATMYLLHHWRIDLLGGLLLSGPVFLIYLPFIRRYERRARQHYRRTGWERLWKVDPWLHQRRLVYYRPVDDDESIQRVDTQNV